jgi:PST family polysaccharide transporter
VNDAAVGLYAAAEKIIRGFQTLTSPVTQALFPHIGKDFYGRAIKYQLDKIWKISITISLTLLIPNILIFFYADFFVKLFCGNGYNESVILVKIMSPVILIGTLNYVLGVIGLVNLNQQKTFFKGVMTAGVSSILFLVLTVPRYGILSASIAIPISELVLLFVWRYLLADILFMERWLRTHSHLTTEKLLLSESMTE